MISMTVTLYYRNKEPVEDAEIEWSDGFGSDWTGNDGVAHLEWEDRHEGRKVTVYYDGKKLGKIRVEEGANYWFYV